MESAFTYWQGDRLGLVYCISIRINIPIGIDSIMYIIFFIVIIILDKHCISIRGTSFYICIHIINILISISVFIIIDIFIITSHIIIPISVSFHIPINIQDILIPGITENIPDTIHSIEFPPRRGCM